MEATTADQFPAEKPENVWASRIVGHGEERSDQLLANPRNWRLHPQKQQQALERLLEHVGWLRPVIVNQRTGHVVDGHLRVNLALSRDETVPVVYVDLSEDEERAILALHDPLAELAQIDTDAYEALTAEVGDEWADLMKLDVGSYRPAPNNSGEDGHRTVLAICPGCGHEWEHDLD